MITITSVGLTALTDAIRAICPIDGVSIGEAGTHIAYRPEATDVQRAAAQLIVDGWDWSEEAEAARQMAADAERAREMLAEGATGRLLAAVIPPILDELDRIAQAAGAAAVDRAAFNAAISDRL